MTTHCSPMIHTTEAHSNTAHGHTIHTQQHTAALYFSICAHWSHDNHLNKLCHSCQSVSLMACLRTYCLTQLLTTPRNFFTSRKELECYSATARHSRGGKRWKELKSGRERNRGHSMGRNEDTTMLIALY